MCLSSCNIGNEYSIEFFAMDTIMSVNAYGNQSKEAVKEVEKEINRLDNLLSVQNKNSDIYKINENKCISPSKETLNIIKKAKKISRLTDGAFDITTEPLTKAWGFSGGAENRVPDKKEIRNILKNVGAENISINNGKITLKNNSSVDLGAIAKGYASHKAGEIFDDYKITSALISLGGNVRAVGSKPDGSPWIVGIADPDNTEKQIGTLSVKDTSVITSGGYQRFFESNGKKYHHIINPHTGYPAENGLKSVTVVSEDDTLGDGLTTGLFVMGLDKAIEFYKENGCFGAVFITDNNDIYVTGNIKDIFKSNRSFEVIE